MRSSIFSISCVAILISLFLSPTSVNGFETTPEDGETGFPIDGVIIIEFDDPMDIGSLDFDITPHPPYPVLVEWSNNDMTLTLNPTANFLEETEYTIFVMCNVEDGAQGTVFETFSFTTGTEETTENNEDLSVTILIQIASLVIVIIVTFVTIWIINRKTY